MNKKLEKKFDISSVLYFTYIVFFLIGIVITIYVGIFNNENLASQAGLICSILSLIFAIIALVNGKDTDKKMEKILSSFDQIESTINNNERMIENCKDEILKSAQNYGRIEKTLEVSSEIIDKMNPLIEAYKRNLDLCQRQLDDANRTSKELFSTELLTALISNKIEKNQIDDLTDSITISKKDYVEKDIYTEAVNNKNKVLVARLARRKRQNRRRK